jgi:hypothetical protein
MVNTATPATTGRGTPTPGTVGPYEFFPLGLVNPSRYNFTGAYPYDDAAIPGFFETSTPGSLPAESLWNNISGGGNFANPPFLSMAAGQLIESLDFGEAGGRPARLLRGFIRRAYHDTNDPNSSCRLNFMYNPPAIQREYVNYLDQGALDPFNTIYQSGNLVAPPAILNFNFELFFDRQNEAMNADNAGVFVDQEFFDKVVRGVRDDQVGTNPVGIPDNGLMLIGAQDITVVFSPNLSVTGRPINASISYIKFTHRMIPTRMVIAITMRAVRIGPPTVTIPDFQPEALAAAARVSTEEQEEAVVSFTRTDVEWASVDEALNTLILNQQNFSAQASGTGNGSAVDHAKAQAAKYNTQYTKTNRMNLWAQADCSSLVWAGFAETNQSEQLGWPKWPTGGHLGSVWAPSTYTMWGGLRDSTAAQKVWGFSGSATREAGLKVMQKGDLIFRVVGDGSVQGENHVAFVEAVSGDSIKLFHAKSTSLGVGSSDYTVSTLPDSYNYCIRPLTSGGSMAANATNDTVAP